MQTFRGPACRSTFTSRRNTPLYRLKTPSHQIAMVLVSAGRRARLIRSPVGLRLSTGHDHEPFCSVLVSTHTPCTSTSSAISGSLTSSWTNYAPGCATPHRCSGWPLILARRFFRCLSSAHARNTWRTWFFTLCDRSWSPFCLPLFTSDGLNRYFYAITAHFGQWLQLSRRGRNVRRWQVEPSLIYGQVKKSYRRRKLARVTPVMRLGTEPALKAALQGLGFSGRLNTAFIERVNLTVRHGCSALARRTWATSQQAPQLLAHVQWWRAYYHFVRPHASLRVALMQTRE
jgi:hypothetical protein